MKVFDQDMVALALAKTLLKTPVNDHVFQRRYLKYLTKKKEVLHSLPVAMSVHVSSFFSADRCCSFVEACQVGAKWVNVNARVATSSISTDIMTDVTHTGTHTHTQAHTRALSLPKTHAHAPQIQVNSLAIMSAIAYACSPQKVLSERVTGCLRLFARKANESASQTTGSHHKKNNRHTN